jgi:hypothetical protein
MIDQLRRCPACGGTWFREVALQEFECILAPRDKAEVVCPVGTLDRPRGARVRAQWRNRHTFITELAESGEASDETSTERAAKRDFTRLTGELQQLSEIAAQ